MKDITALQTNDAGHYWLVASNDAGVRTGTVATLTVLVPPSIVLQPTNQTWVAGSNSSLTVVATGTEPLFYQWYLGATPVTDGPFVASGATTGTLTVSNAQTFNAGNYTVVITNLAGSATSTGALITVVVPPIITVQPKGRSSPLGLPISFNVQPYGSDPFSYQWQLNGTNLPGATLPLYTNMAVTMNDFGAYQVIITNAYGSVTSSVAMLTHGSVAAWGSGSSGQTVPPPGLSNVVAIAASSSFALALKGDGTVAAWGASSGTNVPSNLTNAIAISAGDIYALAVRSDGTVVSWGGSSLATNIPASVSNVVSVSGSPSHALGLRREGTLVEWGISQAKTPIPAGLTQVTSMADGVGFALASRADGSVAAWGSFSAAGFVDPSPPILITNAVSVVAGQNFALALKSDGHISVWGTSPFAGGDQRAGQSHEYHGDCRRQSLAESAVRARIALQWTRHRLGNFESFGDHECSRRPLERCFGCRWSALRAGDRFRRRFAGAAP